MKLRYFALVLVLAGLAAVESGASAVPHRTSRGALASAHIARTLPSSTEEREREEGEMRYVERDLWTATSADAIVIPTNGELTKRRVAIMASGVGEQAADRNPALPVLLGHRIEAHGNHVHVFEWMAKKQRLVAFPTKDDWAGCANASVLHRSAAELRVIADALNWREIALPLAGASLGDKAREILGRFFDDRFHCYVKPRPRL